ncbi:MAG: hypothetical protein V9E94_19245 [Microthrixaceae bacterium]
MLRELKSPETYFQAAFRVQSPWAGTLHRHQPRAARRQMVHKEHCYVLDFAPNRALRQIVDYAITTARRRSPPSATTRSSSRGVHGVPPRPRLRRVLDVAAATLRTSSTSSPAASASSMLARRWNSPELLTLDLNAMERAARRTRNCLESLEQIEMFRNITDDLTAMISSEQGASTEEARQGEAHTRRRSERQNDAANRRDNLREAPAAGS